MKIKDILTEEVVKFPTEKRGYHEDPVTGRYNRHDGPEDPPQFYVISGPDFGGKAYSIHPTRKKADIALKKLRLKGNKEKDLRVVEM